MEKFNGNRLKTARLYNGLTIEELANKIEITKQAISSLENEKMAPSFDTLLALSRELKFPITYFMQKNLVQQQDKIGVTYFRSLLRTSKKYKVEQNTKMSHIAYVYEFLNRYISFPKINLPETNEGLSPSEAAVRIRQHWGLDESPILNLIQLLEKNGIIVTSFQTETNDIDAFSHKHNDLYIVVLSQNKNVAARSNFDTAHELGHIVLHDWYEDLETLSHEEIKQREKEANTFAAAFLLPQKAFSRDLENLPNLKLQSFFFLKRKWHVSVGAILYRARELDFITTTQYQNFIREMHKKGWYKNEPFDEEIALPRPTMFKEAIHLLLQENIFTTASFVQALSDDGCAMNYKELEFLLNLPEGMLAPSAEICENKILKLR